MNASLLRARLDTLAADLGRLNRRLDGDTYSGFLVWRLAEHVESIDAMLGPTAADRARELLAAGADEDEAVTCAIAQSDARARRLRDLLGSGAVL